MLADSYVFFHRAADVLGLHDNVRLGAEITKEAKSVEAPLAQELGYGP